MIKVKISEKVYELEKDGIGFEINGEKVAMDILPHRDGEFHIISRDQSITAKVLAFDPVKKSLTISLCGQVFNLEIREEHDELLEKINFATGNGQNHEKILSPMPGLIQKILVNEYDDIQSGDPVLVLNAMKMENVLKSPVSGKVKDIFVKEGEQVEKGKVLIQF